MCDIQTILQRI